MSVKFIAATKSSVFPSCLPELIAEALFYEMRREEKINGKNQGKNDQFESEQASRTGYGGACRSGNAE